MPILLFFLCLFLSFVNFASVPSIEVNHQPVVTSSLSLDSKQLYQSMQLMGKINFTAFDQVINGYNQLSNFHNPIITLIDFSLPSNVNRFFVLDVLHKKVLFSSVVTHGKKSGEQYATSFSNQYGSNKSSLGFYLTGTTYQGKNGYSLILNGLEKGINDNAKQRAIVIHGASYADPKVVAYTGRLGRSLGCPALPVAIAHKVIDQIKGGSLLFIYANSPDYLQHSRLLSKQQLA